jgi:hypothetical protein
MPTCNRKGRAFATEKRSLHTQDLAEVAVLYSDFVLFEAAEDGG